jgi:hypothetical protein
MGLGRQLAANHPKNAPMAIDAAGVKNGRVFKDVVSVSGARSRFLRAFSRKVTPDSRGSSPDHSLQNSHPVR